MSRRLCVHKVLGLPCFVQRAEVHERMRTCLRTLSEDVTVFKLVSSQKRLVCTSVVYKAWRDGLVPLCEDEPVFEGVDEVAFLNAFRVVCPQKSKERYVRIVRSVLFRDSHPRMRRVLRADIFACARATHAAFDRRLDPGGEPHAALQKVIKNEAVLKL